MDDFLEDDEILVLVDEDEDDFRNGEPRNATFAPARRVIRRVNSRRFPSRRVIRSRPRTQVVRVPSRPRRSRPIGVSAGNGQVSLNLGALGFWAAVASRVIPALQKLPEPPPQPATVDNLTEYTKALATQQKATQRWTAVSEVLGQFQG